MLKRFSDGIFTVPSEYEVEYNNGALDHIDGSWVVDADILFTSLKNSSFDVINNKYEEYIEKGFKCFLNSVGHTFDIDDKSIATINSRLSRILGDEQDNIVIADNLLKYYDSSYKECTFTLSEIKQFCRDADNYRDALDKYKLNLKFLLNNVTNEDELERVLNISRKDWV